MSSPPSAAESLVPREIAEIARRVSVVATDAELDRFIEWVKKAPASARVELLRDPDIAITAAAALCEHLPVEAFDDPRILTLALSWGLRVVGHAPGFDPVRHAEAVLACAPLELRERGRGTATWRLIATALREARAQGLAVPTELGSAARALFKEVAWTTADRAGLVDVLPILAALPDLTDEERSEVLRRVDDVCRGYGYHQSAGRAPAMLYIRAVTPHVEALLLTEGGRVRLSHVLEHASAPLTRILLQVPMLRRDPILRPLSHRFVAWGHLVPHVAPSAEAFDHTWQRLVDNAPHYAAALALEDAPHLPHLRATHLAELLTHTEDHVRYLAVRALAVVPSRDELSTATPPPCAGRAPLSPR